MFVKSLGRDENIPTQMHTHIHTYTHTHILQTDSRSRALIYQRLRSSSCWAMYINAHEHTYTHIQIDSRSRALIYQRLRSSSCSTKERACLLRALVEMKIYPPKKLGSGYVCAYMCMLVCIYIHVCMHACIQCLHASVAFMWLPRDKGFETWIHTYMHKCIRTVCV